MSIDCPYCRYRATEGATDTERCPACSRMLVHQSSSSGLQTAKKHSSDLDDYHPLGLQAHDSEPEDTNKLHRINPDTDPDFRLIHERVNRPVAQELFETSEEDSATQIHFPQYPSIQGYILQDELGHGGMGTVYLARQLSLDRPVAVKVMSRKWAGDPVFLARFVREAYAAAQLSHPNIVQIYDIGTVENTRYFSMEYVRGKSLAEVIHDRGKIEPEIAMGYILQAARGLKHAHDRGMIHRDIKPDNLLLSEQGIVKVADLGLVKTPDLRPDEDSLDEFDLSSERREVEKDMTGARMALGTPAYMSPEQCRDAAKVDHRADIYSLGCTLYAAVTGRPPFDAESAVEVMTKQAYHALVPPELIASRVSKELSAIIQKMMEKDPADRYQTMGEVVRVLEEWLGVHQAGTYAPRESEISALEQLVLRFNNAPAVILRERVVAGFLSACVLVALILTMIGRLGWAFGVAGMVVQASMVYFILTGLTTQSYLFQRFRQMLRGLTLGDAMVGLAGLVLFGLFLWMLKLFWIWIGFGLIGAGLAFGLRFALDQSVADDRKPHIAAGQKLIQRFRRRGLDEQTIRQLFAKYSGQHWEEYFEALFGFEAKMTARALLLRGGYAGEREKYASWREPVIGIFDKIEKHRREERERKVLVETEQARLMARGYRPGQARQEAERRADLLVKRAHDIRVAESKRGMLPVRPGAAKPVPDTSAAIPGPGTTIHSHQETPYPAPNLKNLISAYDPADRQSNPDVFEFLAWLWFGPHIRLCLATVLLIMGSLWAMQNLAWDLHAAHEGRAAIWRYLPSPHAEIQPLTLPGVPLEFTAWCKHVNVLWAGVLLLASVYFRGAYSGFLVITGAAVALLGHQFDIRTVEPIQDYHVALVLGTMICLVGYRFGQK